MRPKVSNAVGRPLNDQIIACLEKCFQDLYSNDEDRRCDWEPDPYFERKNGKPLPTMADADNLIEVLKQEFQYEINVSGSWHANNNGSKFYPQWELMPDFMRLGLAYKLCAIADEFEDETDQTQFQFYYTGSAEYELDWHDDDLPVATKKSNTQVKVDPAVSSYDPWDYEFYGYF